MNKYWRTRKLKVYMCHMCIRLSHAVKLHAELESMKQLQLEKINKMDGLLYNLLEEKDRELQEIEQVEDTQFLQGMTMTPMLACHALILARRVFLEHFIEISVVMVFTSKIIAKQLLDSDLITENNFDEVSREDDTKSGMERGTVLMKALKATINRQPGLMTSLIKVLEKNEAFKSIAMKMEHRIS